MVKCIITQAEELLRNIKTEAEKIDYTGNSERIELAYLYESISDTLQKYKAQAPGGNVCSQE